MVLVSKGFRKVAFCDFPVLFQHTIQSIAGPHEDEELLMFLAAYLRSPLARYFIFHTAANWGTERDKVHLDELLRLPFPLPSSEQASAKGDRIIREVAQRVRDFRAKLGPSSARDDRTPQNCDILKLDGRFADQDRRRLTDSVQIELNELVYRYFGLTKQETMLVEDTTEVFIPSSTPHDWWSKKDVFTLQPVQTARPVRYKAGIQVYAITLTQTLNGWAAEQGSTYRVGATGGVDKESSLALITLELTDREVGFQQIEISAKLWKALETYRHRVAKQKKGTLTSERDIVLFQGTKIHIVRPGILANWTRTAALNDAANLYAELAATRKTRA